MLSIMICVHNSGTVVLQFAVAKSGNLPDRQYKLVINILIQFLPEDLDLCNVLYGLHSLNN